MIEFVHDLDPNVSDTDSLRLPVLTRHAGTLEIAWIWNKKRSMGLGVGVRYSETLAPGSWQPLGAPVEFVADPGGGLESVRVLDPDYPLVTRRFYQLSYGN